MMYADASGASNQRVQFPIVKTILVGLTAAASLVYILNPGCGIVELIPDNFPGIGNIDEAGATVVLIWCLRYFKTLIKTR